MIIKLFILLFTVMFFSSCGKKIISKKFYVIEFPAKSDMVEITTPLTKSVCEILPIKMSPAFAQRRIAIRKKSNQINYFSYHMWAENPGEVIAILIEKEIQKAHTFSQASSTIWNVVPQYQLSIQIFQLEAVEAEFEDDNILNAHVHGRFELYDRENNRVAVVHDFNKFRFLEKRDVNLLADQVSQILYEETQELVKKSNQYVIALNRSRIQDAVNK